MTTPRISPSYSIKEGSGTLLRYTTFPSLTTLLRANGPVSIKCCSGERHGTSPKRTSSRSPTRSTSASPWKGSIASPPQWRAGLNSRAAPLFPEPRSIASGHTTPHGSLPANASGHPPRLGRYPLTHQGIPPRIGRYPLKYRSTPSWRDPMNHHKICAPLIAACLLVPLVAASPVAAAQAAAPQTAPAQTAAAQATSPLAPITHQTLWMMKRVGAPIVSPDGKWVAFSVLEA